MIKSIYPVFFALRDGFLHLRRKDPLILSSSTAFFATFALSPILILLIQIFSATFQSDSIKRQFFQAIGSTVGTEAAIEIERIVFNFTSIERDYFLLTALGVIFLLFVSTTLLAIIKKAIQRIWQLRPKPQLKLKYHSKERGVHLAFLMFTGAMILLSFYVNIRLRISLDYLQAFWPSSVIRVVIFLGSVFSLIVITFWFTVLFKWIPDARITWDSAFSGGLVTGLLFIAGRMILGNILVHARIETIFGASASFALLLLFIFYCSFILYFGAAFTYQYAEQRKHHICATRYSDEYEERVIGQDE